VGKVYLCRSVEPLQVDGIHTLGHQVGVDERDVGELVLGVVVDVLGHVTVEHLQGSGGIGGASASP
jgi:hypothetical protein